MLVLPTTAAELQPGTRVAVFPRNDASGETIGFFGTVIGARRVYNFLPAQNPAAWHYWVDGSTGWQFVKASQLLIDATDDGQLAESVTDIAWEAEFDDELAQQGKRIAGKYRLAKRGWARFEFVKGTDDIPHYELRLAAKVSASQTPALLWRVPAGTTLDRKYVMHALTELFGPGP